MEAEAAMATADAGVVPGVGGNGASNPAGSPGHGNGGGPLGHGHGNGNGNGIGRDRGWFQLPEGLSFHQGHTWVRPNGGTVVTVGMSEFARKLVGASMSINLPPAGTRLEQGLHAWEVVVDGTPIPMLSPVDGEVLEVNTRAMEAPGELLESPYEDGWLLKVGVNDARSRASLKNLLAGSPARAWMEEIEERLRTLQSGELGVVMPDGGEPVDGMARALSPEDWERVAREFLLAD
jgi:glycine cleavage system H protein